MSRNGKTDFDWEAEARTVATLNSRLELLELARAKETVVLASAQDAVTHAKQAQDVLQYLAQAVQQKAHQRISSVVSSCLSAVFDDPYEFKIEFDRKRGRTEARLLFVRGDMEVDPLTAAGGGMVDVAAFALRVACLVLHRPRLSRLLVLDEPFRFVSAQYQEGVRSMLEQLSADMKIQIIFVTHNADLATGQIETL